MKIRSLVVGILAGVLVACGGGGSGSGASSSSSGGSTRPMDTIVLTTTAPSEPIPAGLGGNFVFTLTNYAPNAARDVYLEVTLGPGFQSYFSVDCEAEGIAVCPSGINSTRVPVLQPGGALHFTVRPRVEYPTSGTVTVSATAHAPNDTVTSNNSAQITGTAFSTDVGVSLAASSHDLSPGDVASFLMTVTNTGPDAAPDVVVDAGISGRQSLTGITCVAQGGAICPSSPALDMVIPSLAGGGSLLFQINTLLDAEAFASVAARATVLARGDVNFANYESLASAYLIPPALSASPSFAIFRSETADILGNGADYSYDAGNDVFVLQDYGDRVSFGINSLDVGSWRVDFTKPASLDRWEPGLHEVAPAPGSGFPSPGSADLSVGHSSGCGHSGWFRILDVQYAADELASMDVLFALHCSGRAPALRGRIHWVR